MGTFIKAHYESVIGKLGSEINVVSPYKGVRINTHLQRTEGIIQFEK